MNAGRRNDCGLLSPKTGAELCSGCDGNFTGVAAMLSLGGECWPSPSGLGRPVCKLAFPDLNTARSPQNTAKH